MDKNTIKKYAVWARNELIERVSQKADQYEIGADADPNADAAHGILLTPSEKKQRVSLITKVKDKGMDQVIEEVAYTWFNRFAALRFMEVNNYLPSKVRVFTDDEGAFKPEILAEAIHLEMEGLDMEKVYALKDANDDDALFKYLIITQCNTLSKVLPGMFQKIADYTELLFPDNQLREGSVIEQMVAQIPEEDWKDQVQIIGWLYEGYNAERNELVYDGSYARKKVPKELLPAATTIFTPDWPVHYMVENSLGRIWLEGHPNNNLKKNWKYYLEEAKQEPEVQKQLDAIHREYSALKPVDIRTIDPCMGSGHIICYLFDVLMQIYEVYGYNSRDAVSSIVKNNLYGLDIDDRASQLAYFSVMMKACQYDRRFLSRDIQPHVYAIMESNYFDPNMIDFFADGRKELKAAINSLISDLHDAKEYGSILNVTPVDFAALYARFDEIKNENPNFYTHRILDELLPFVQMAEVMTHKYQIVITNPPYLGSARFNIKLDKYIKKNYGDVKSDLSMVMYKHAIDSMVKKNGFVSFITTSSWMFLSSFEKLRMHLQSIASFSTLVDYGTELFDGKVGHNPIVSWIIRKKHMESNFVAIRLVDYCYSIRDRKEPEFFDNNNRYIARQSNFTKIPGSPIAYWASQALIKSFEGKKIKDYGFAGIGMRTGDNARFLRFWNEIDQDKMLVGCQSAREQIKSQKKWIPYNKGGEFRKWYGNNSYVVNWQNDGQEIKENTKKTYPQLGDNLGWKISNESYYYKKGITWSGVTSGAFSCRCYEEGFIFDSGANGLFAYDESDRYYLAGFLNSSVGDYIIKMINPTINTGSGTLNQLPLLVSKDYKDQVISIVKNNIALSRLDWDSFENSWDFQRHPLIRSTTTIKEAFSQWQQECDERFNQLKSNEEELNRIFIDIYGLQDELTPEEEDKDVTVRKADLERDIRSFVSYAVGCMMGRYSLDVDGLAYAGGDWDSSKYKTFIPDKDAIIPITDDEYFKDDIVGRFVEFVRTVYGADTLEENLKFIADALDEKGTTPREVIRNYFLNDFYKDHCKIYQKRPIYWLFDSGKKNGFKCLIYMHRYQPDTIARIRTDYVHEQQARYRTAISGLERQINGAPTSERVRLNKQLTKLKDQAEETRLYEEKIHHLADQMISIDLDDGVKHNYAIFQDVLAKIK